MLFNTLDGVQGQIDPAEQPLDGSVSRVWITLPDGKRLWVPWDLLQFKEDGTVFLPLNLAEENSQTTTPTGAVVFETTTAVPGRRSGQETVIPVVQEELDVSKRQKVTGRVRLTKTVNTRQETVDEVGFQEEVQVERLPVGKVLEAPAQVRQEGDTTVIPIMEEVLVVEKRLLLKEEIRVTKVRKEVGDPNSTSSPPPLRAGAGGWVKMF